VLAPFWGADIYHEPSPQPYTDEMMPARRVTDRAELQKLKAEFPELALDLGPKPHVADHRSYSGTRRDFEWGAIPVAEAAAPAVPSPAAAPIADQPVTAPSRDAGAGSAAAAVGLSSSDPLAVVPAELSGSTFSWGEVAPVARN